MKDTRTKITELIATGLTQAALGELVGVGQGAISKIVRGVHSEMRYSNALRLDALHLRRCATKAKRAQGKRTRA